jgi:hypothetical protein
MADDFGVDLEEVYRVIDSAEVLVVRFHLIGKRLLIDFRKKDAIPPFIALVPRAESIEDRFRSIKRLRPGLPFPEKLLSFQWPRSIGLFLESGAWERIVDRLIAIGDDSIRLACGHVVEDLRSEERSEVFGAIRGAEHYQTLWERTKA